MRIILGCSYSAAFLFCDKVVIYEELERKLGMRVKKEQFITSLFIILLVLLWFLPNFVNSITSEEIKHKITIIMSVLVLLFLIYVTYDDIRKKKFTTIVYIVLLDSIGIINFVALCYTFFIYSGETNFEAILHKNNIRLVCLLIQFCISVLSNYFKRDKFIKNQ